MTIYTDPYGWNGLSLQNEFATLLGDTSTAFKAKVLQYINDVQVDICSRHDWPFLKVKGQKVLTASSERQSLLLSTPSAVTPAIDAGGSLTAGSSYFAVVTFYEGVSGVESSYTLTGINSVSADAVNKTLKLTNIPVSADPLVTARKIYLSKDLGPMYYHSTISDNTTTTATITSNSIYLGLPPDASYFRKLESNPFFEGNNSGYLELMSPSQLRLLFQGSWNSGTPELYGEGGGEGSIIVYPTPSTALTLSFYYFKNPPTISAEVQSFPILPIFLKPVLKAGVIALGYEYRDRAGQEVKAALYEKLLTTAISNNGTMIKTSGRVRDVIGDSNGNAL